MTPFICLVTIQLSFPGGFFNIPSLQPLLAEKTYNEQAGFCVYLGQLQ